MKKNLFLIVLLLLSFQISAQTINLIGAAGYDLSNSELTTSNFISGLTTASRFKSFKFTITCDTASGIDLSLEGSNGVRIPITSGNGGDGNNYTNTIIDVDATTLISSASAPFTGNYLPEGNLGTLNGINLNGYWLIRVRNNAGGYARISSTSITFEDGILPDFVNLLTATSSITLGSNTTILAQVQKTGLTDITSGQTPGIQAWLGYSSTNSDPRSWTNWIPATYNQEVGDSDEYTATFGSTITPPGIYYYTMRFRINNNIYFYAGVNGLYDGTNIGNGVLTISPAPIPTNNNCSGAIPLTVNPGYICNSSTSGSVAGATQSLVDANSCAGTEDDDVWFSFVALGAVHVAYISNVAGSTSDLSGSLWVGNCSNLTLVQGSCFNDSARTFSGLTIGQTYYLRIYTTTTVPLQTTSFNVCITGLDTTPEFVSLHSPNIAYRNPGESITVYGRITEVGLTDVTEGQSPYIQAWVGYTNNGSTNPYFNASYIWIPATFNQEVGNSDEYMATFGSDLPNGMYNYVTRFQIANGDYYYGGINNNAVGNFWSSEYNVGKFGIRPWNASCNLPIPLTVGNVFDDFAVTSSLNGASIGENIPNYINCNGTTMEANSGVNFTAVIPASGSIAVETKIATNSSIDDTVMFVSIGNCNELIVLQCNDNSSQNNLFSKVVLFGLPPGDLLRIKVYKKGNVRPSLSYQNFKISAYMATLGIDSFDDNAFSYSPNPVTDMLHLSYSKEIAAVEVFDTMGRKVYDLHKFSNEANVDMSLLSRGIYMIRITADNQSKVIKIMKE